MMLGSAYLQEVTVLIDCMPRASGLNCRCRFMATREQDVIACEQCGAKLTSGRRYCVHCYSPVGTSATRAHVESAREITTTRKVDPTIVFSPERHEAMLSRARSRKRMLIAAVIAVAVVAGGSIALQVISRHQREAEKLMARDRAAQRELSALADALERFKADLLRYPTNEEGLRSLARKPAVIKQDSEHLNYWFGPYLDSVPEVDPWGNDYIYHTTDGGRSFELFSYGPEGETGSDSRFQVISPSATASDR